MGEGKLMDGSRSSQAVPRTPAGPSDITMLRRPTRGIGGSDQLEPPPATLPVNRWIVGETVKTVQALDIALAELRFDESANAVYQFTWGTFCDWYLELIKGQIDDETKEVAAWVLDQILVMLHPFMPFVTEEVWSWWRDGSIHVASWPTAAELDLLLDDAATDGGADRDAYAWATDVLFEVRKQRSEAKQPLKVPITKVVVTAEPACVGLMAVVEADLRSALRVKAFETAVG